ncbi:MAG: hypothetical protein ACP5JG_17355 [Anaerolineae bacterium]
MPKKMPLDYELTPQETDAGRRWLTLSLMNISDAELRELSVTLNSTDTYQIDVHGTGSFVPRLRPNESERLPFQVTANGSARVYAAVDGWRRDEEFHWESPGIPVVVGLDVARLVSLFALTEPYPILGTPITLEATIEGLAFNEGLGLEFWAETPRGEFKSLAKMPTDPIEEGEVVTYTTQFEPEEEGVYTLHAYLFAGTRRIGHAIEYVSITR